ncbi:hypothetical protein, partial [Escherichia coli]|uniref:hypothetical protein n=1 Tax=Escherichia coli TaxID=562 RepID=UPI0022853077
MSDKIKKAPVKGAFFVFADRRILPDPLAAANWNTMPVPPPPRQEPSMHTALFLLACLAAYGLATYLLQVPLW